MDNALVIDGVLAVVLLAGALIGAKRGLFKSLMGVVVVIAALIGAVLLADMLTDPITDLIAPKVEDAVVQKFADTLERTSAEDSQAGGGVRDGVAELSALAEEYGLSGDVLNGLLRSFEDTVHDFTEQAKEKAEGTFRDAISAGVRSVVSGTVHAVLVLVLYLVLLIVLKLLTNALDHVFDLPVLGTLNGTGGAVLGLLEAALLLYVVLYAASHLGVQAITDHADEGYLLPLFLNHSPIELISSLF